MARYVFDAETNGLLRATKTAKAMDRIHCLVLRDADTHETLIFRRNAKENTIADGVALLQGADEIIGHNIAHFDIKAIQLLYPDFVPQGVVTDTLVLSRLIIPDTKGGDFRLHKNGHIPGYLIGSHSLDAWGYRLGKHKGDYAKEMIKNGLDPWSEWNQEMEDYCVNDVDVTELLWAAMEKDMPAQTAIDLEMDIHAIVGHMEANGYFFDLKGAEALAAEIREKIEVLSDKVVEAFGVWYKPKKKSIVKMQWDDPKGINRAKTYAMPNREWGEDFSRAVWGGLKFPKLTMRGRKGMPDRTEGCPYVEIERVEFNPRSRAHIVDRFTTIYGWTPDTFTDAGAPSVDDSVLTKLIESIPEAKDLADILFLQKRLGQISSGKTSWLNSYNPATERIHPYTNTGGTVSGRCSHSHPNIAQVPSVRSAKIKNGRVMDGDTDLNLAPADYIAHGNTAILLKEHGEYGFECRSLFYTPPFINDVPWVQVGVDLSGIEFRCLAERCAKYDNGELIQVVLSGDIHAINMASTGISDRPIIKRGLYGLLYGAGDWKLGHTIDPTASDNAKRALGRSFREKLMRGLPALKAVSDECQDQAEHGYLIGIDGRVLPVRAVYAALNLRLQSDAGLVAKKWVTLTEKAMFDRGYAHGWRGDFSFLAFVHDELQAGVRADIAEEYKAACIKAAADAGDFFNFQCPLDAEGKIGANWGECH